MPEIAKIRHLIKHTPKTKIIGMTADEELVTIQIRDADGQAVVEQIGLAPEPTVLFSGPSDECGDVIDGIVRAQTLDSFAANQNDDDGGFRMGTTAKVAMWAAALVIGGIAGSVWQSRNYSGQMLETTALTGLSVPEIIQGAVNKVSTSTDPVVAVLPPSASKPAPAQPTIAPPPDLTATPAPTADAVSGPAPAIAINATTGEPLNAPETPAGPKAPVISPAPDTEIVGNAKAVLDMAAKEGVPAPAAAPSPAAQAAAALGGLTARSAVAGDQLKSATEQAKSELKDKGQAIAEADMKKMQTALASLMSGETISPEVARELPPEIAAKLRDAGVIQSLEDAQTLAGKPAHAIIRLPQTAVDKYRNADGIASIPETNSWAASGGNVILPMPGGGDIINPKTDFGLFNLKS